MMPAKKAMHYACNYCNVHHDISTRSKEHVIPKALKNKSYVLPNVCKFWNNFFAVTFEKNVLNDGFTQEILLAYGLVDRRATKYIGPVTTADGKTEHRWLNNGTVNVRDFAKPEYEDSCQLELGYPDGTVKNIELILPFQIPKALRGDALFVEAKRDRYLAEWKAAKEKVREFIKRAQIEPGLVPEIYEHAQLFGTWEPMDNSKIHELSETPVQVIDNINELLFPLDLESLRRFYLKIAWCHACNSLPSNQLSSLNTKSLVDCLKSNYIPVDVAQSCLEADYETCEQLFAIGTADNEEVWYWKQNLDNSKKLVATAKSQVRIALGPLLQQRESCDRHLRNRVLIEPRTLSMNDGALIRTHQIRLTNELRPGLGAMSCRIQLFGGLMFANVILTDWHSMGHLPAHPFTQISINF